MKIATILYLQKETDWKNVFRKWGPRDRETTAVDATFSGWEIVNILEELAKEEFRLGDLQAIRYDRNNALFGERFLVDLYLGLGSGRRTPFRRENLQMLFCGMTDLSLPAILSFWNTQRLIILGKWENGIWRTGGVSWVSAIVGTKERSGFGAYGMLRWVWGTEDAEWMGFLSLARMFHENNLTAIHGQRYKENHLTARFMQKYGFLDIGTLPHCLPLGEKLEPCVISTCTREKFEMVLESKILQYA